MLVISVRDRGETTGTARACMVTQSCLFVLRAFGVFTSSPTKRLNHIERNMRLDPKSSTRMEGCETTSPSVYALICEGFLVKH